MQNLNFILVGRTGSGLTQIWRVESVHNGNYLGDVKWFSNWRRYAFYDGAANVFDAVCFREIANFMDEQMEIRSRDRQLRQE